jgi:DNA-binding MarR family transcriptional regulator
MAIDKDTKALNKALSLCSAFQTVEQTMPIQVAKTFLTIALFPGRSLRAYQDILGVNEATLSRHCLDLGARNRQKEPGYGLIDQRSNPTDLRQNVYTLTPKGKALIHTIAKALEG